jgi:hypothetical protein
MDAPEASRRRETSPSNTLPSPFSIAQPRLMVPVVAE